MDRKRARSNDIDRETMRKFVLGLMLILTFLIMSCLIFGDKIKSTFLVWLFKCENNKIQCVVCPVVDKRVDSFFFKPVIKLSGHRDPDIQSMANGIFHCPGTFKEAGRKNINFLIKMSDSHESQKVRSVSVAILGVTCDERALKSIMKALGDKDAEVRASAVQAIHRMLNQYSFPYLVESLSDKDKRVRAAAARSLGEIKDKKAVPHLLQLLSDKEIEVKASSIFALGMIEDRRAVVPIIKSLKEKDSDTKLSALYALGKMPDKRAIGAIIKLLDDNDNRVQYRASRLLSDFKGNKCISNNEVAEELIKIVVKGKDHPDIQALVLLGEFPHKKAFKPLMELIDNKDPYIRQFSITALGKIGNKRACVHIIKKLKDENIDVKSACACALGGLKCKKAVKPLVSALSDGSPGVRVSSIHALSNIGDKRVIDPLISCLEDKEYLVRTAAAQSLGKLKAKKAVLPLIKLLYRKLRYDEGDPYMAAWALGEIGDKRAIRPLILILGRNNKQIRLSSIGALGKLGDQKTIEQLERFNKNLESETKKKIEKITASGINSRYRQQVECRIQSAYLELKSKAIDAIARINTKNQKK